MNIANLVNLNSFDNKDAGTCEFVKKKMDISKRDSLLNQSINLLTLLNLQVLLSQYLQCFCTIFLVFVIAEVW